MKTLIIVSATIFFAGLTALVKNVPAAAEKGHQIFVPKMSMNYLAYNKSFDIGKMKDLSDNLRYEVRGTYKRSVKKQTLSNAKLISDIIPDYPVNWIATYGSVEILATSNGEFITAVSPNDTLTVEQKNVLSNVDMASDVVINVNYTYKVPVTNVIENNTMHVLMTLVPEVQAEYAGGYEQLINYLKESTISQLSVTDPKKFRQVIIKFTIGEGGEIIDAKISQSSNDSKTNKLLLDAINKMPNWKPAENSLGIKVKQEFEFIVGSMNGDGC